MDRKIYNVFKSMPKPSNLHTHFSAIVSYRKILNLVIENDDVRVNLYYDPKNFNLEYSRNPKPSFKLINEICIENIKSLINDSNIDDPDIFSKISSIFFGIIRYKDFFQKYYLPAIISHMKMHNIKYMEVRSKLGSVYDLGPDKKIPVSILEELELLYQYKDYFKIIVQTSKYITSDAVVKYFDEIHNLIRKTKYTELVIGYDIVGDEINSNSIEYFFNGLNNLKNKYPNEINYYLHAGEILYSNKSLDNIKYAVRLDSKRIGHGINLIYNNHNVNKSLLNEAFNKKILFEICPLSNLYLFHYYPAINNIVKYIDHIVIGSDDNNKQRTNLSLDFMFLYMSGISLLQIKQLLINSISHNYDFESFVKDFDVWYSDNSDFLGNTNKNVFIIDGTKK